MTLSPSDTPAYRVHPHNEEAEQALLGALLVNNHAYEKVSEFPRTEHFFGPVHGQLYEAIVKFIERGQVHNPVTLDWQHSSGNIAVPSPALFPLYGAQVGDGTLSCVQDDTPTRLRVTAPAIERVLARPHADTLTCPLVSMKASWLVNSLSVRRVLAPALLLDNKRARNGAILSTRRIAGLPTGLLAYSPSRECAVALLCWRASLLGCWGATVPSRSQSVSS